MLLVYVTSNLKKAAVNRQLFDFMILLIYPIDY